MAQSIDALLARISDSNPKNAEEQATLLAALNETREALALKGESAGVLAYLDGAGLLISYLAQMGHVAGPEVHSVVTRLLDVAQKSVSIRSGHEVEPAQPVGWDDNGASVEDTMRLIGDMMLGEVLVKLGRIRPTQIEAALVEQHATGMRFGEALMKSGAVTWSELEEGLRYQDSFRQVVEEYTERRKPQTSPRAPLPEREEQVLPRTEGDAESRAVAASGLRLISDVMLGEILIEKERITGAALKQALETQKAVGVRLGQALVEAGACTWKDIEYGVQLQSQVRRYC